MNRPIALLMLLTMTVTTACSSTTPDSEPALVPPKAAVKPHRLERHGSVRIDDYYWLRDRESAEVLRYLQAENAYTDSVLAPQTALQKQIFEEIVARMPQRDQSVPVFADGFWYYSRYEEGKEYAIHARRKGSLDAAEEILVDGNALAIGSGYFSLTEVTASPDGALIAFATDTTGRRIYTQRFKDMRTGELLPEIIPNVTGKAAWASDSRTVFYVKQHPETLRWHQIWRHAIGTDPSTDVLVYEEPDETFDVSISRSKSGRFLIVHSSQTITDEVRILDSDSPLGEFRIFEPRARGREYQIEHLGDAFYIRTNDGARNFRIMKTPLDRTGRESWSEVVPHRADTFIDDFDVFPEHLGLLVRRDALTRLEVFPIGGGAPNVIAFDEPAYVLRFGDMHSLEAPLRFVYTSLTTPASTFDLDPATGDRTLRKRQPVGGGFDPANYATERLFATARDGARIPITVAYRRGFTPDGSSPLMLYGYGSYGISSDPVFSTAIPSLLDRGFVYAIAHVRGGQELGREWYEAGKLLQKKNTFTDFIDVAEFLIASKYADRNNVFAAGGSAGGLLMGAVVNIRPDLWKGILARVPFVDVVTTMLDDSIPLTTSEYDEWGDPNEKIYYDYMLSYSPYDHVESKEYPNILITTGLHDSQVQYFEPAKWVAKMRALGTGRNKLLLKTYMEAGHGGASGRFRRQEETAIEYAFFVSLAGPQPSIGP